jgi:hypothetical protein
MGFLLGLGLLERHKLAFGQDQALLGHLGLERLEALRHGLEVMALPHGTHAGGRDGVAALADLVGDPDLAEGGLLQGQRDDLHLDLGRRAVLQDRLAAGQFLQGELAAGLIKLLEAIEAVARVAHHLAGLADIAELLGQFQQPDLHADDLLLVRHGGVLSNAEAGRCAPRPLRARPRLMPQPNDTVCQVKSKLLHLMVPGVVN